MSQHGLIMEHLFNLVSISKLEDMVLMFGFKAMV